MNETTSFSPTLVLKGGQATARRIACRSCGHDLGPADGDWKELAVLDEQPLAEAGGEAFRAAGSDVLLRRFYCPSCGTTLDAETALPGEPFLVDRVRG
jgi:acetone carboxylase gamma subunit